MNEAEKGRLELEAETLRMFAIFFAVLSALVFVGTFFASAKTSTLVISLAGGLSLAFVSLIARFFSKRIFRKIEQFSQAKS